MSLQELTMLLARIQVLDNRQVDQLTIEAWEPLMEGVEYADAVAAVNAHFRESTEYLKPAHIINGIYAARMRSLPDTMSAARPDCGSGSHRRLPDGTCIICPSRIFPEDES